MSARLSPWLCFISSLIIATGCSKLTTPTDERVTPLPEPAVSSAPSVQPPSGAVPAKPPAPVVEEKVRASQIVIAYKGAKSASSKVTRTKQQAKKLADELSKRAQKEDFAALAKKYSDELDTSSKGGDLGEFTRTQKPKPIADSVFALRSSQVSEALEADDGFHIVKRTSP